MAFIKGSKIFKIIMPALLIVALLASFMGASTAVLADSIPARTTLFQVVHSGQNLGNWNVGIWKWDGSGATRTAVNNAGDSVVTWGDNGIGSDNGLSHDFTVTYDPTTLDLTFQVIGGSKTVLLNAVSPVVPPDATGPVNNLQMAIKASAGTAVSCARQNGLLTQQVDSSKTTLTNLLLNNLPLSNLEVEARLIDNPTATSFTNTAQADLPVPATGAWTLTGTINVEYVAANMAYPPKQDRIGLSSIDGQYIAPATITASSGPGGSISPAGDIPINYTGAQTFEITADQGYHITDILVDAISVGAIGTYTFNDVRANHAIEAVFAADLPVDHLVVGGQYEPGTLGTEMDIMINGGPALPGWCVNEHVDIQVGTQYPVEIYGYLDYFGESYPANIGSLPAAVITNTYSQTTINWPAIAYIINNKATGASFMDIQKAMWYFSDNDVSGLSTNTQNMVDAANSYLSTHDNVYIPGIGQLTAMIGYVPDTTPRQVVFYEYTIPQVTHQVTFVLGEHGTLTGGDLVQMVNFGADAVAPLVTASTGWTFTGWDNSFTNVTANLTVNAQYSQNEVSHTIIASGGSNGSISPAGEIIVNNGASQSFSITPNIGYHVQAVLVDGISVGTVIAYSFDNVTSNHVIEVSFIQAWDANGDHVINVLDLILIGMQIGRTGIPGWIPEDVNLDGVVNVLDLVIVGNNIGQIV